MAHTSPAASLAWALFSTLLGVFLLFHLWSFDRFKCLKWNNGPHSTAFKRLMTYSYLLSVPLIATYSVGFTIIKYHYGFMYVPGLGISPTPYELWSNTARNAMFPLYLCFSVAWSLEMVTHLEELCFWLFLVNAGAAQQCWFRSPYFKIWAAGSTLAVLYMPIVTIFTRQDPYKCEAYTFLAGSLGSLSLTVWFLPVLWTFPIFLRSLKSERVDDHTIVRLTKFHEMNTIRIVFRFLFTVSLVILGVDGVRPHQHINDKMFPVDLLSMVAAVGCTISSALTLMIFFPRSIEGEIAARDANRTRRTERTTRPTQSQFSQFQGSQYFDESYVLTTPTRNTGSVALEADEYDKYDNIEAPYDPSAVLPQLSTFKTNKLDIDHEESDAGIFSPPSIVMQPNRRMRNGDVELGAVLTENNAARHNGSKTNANYLMHNYTSPLNVGGYSD